MTDVSWARARQLARKARASGFTVPGADLVIAGCAWSHGVPMEHDDQHLSALHGLFEAS